MLKFTKLYCNCNDNENIENENLENPEIRFVWYSSEVSSDMPTFFKCLRIKREGWTNGRERVMCGQRTGNTYRCELARPVASILGKRPMSLATTLPYETVDHLVLEDNEKRNKRNIPFQSKISKLLRSDRKKNRKHDKLNSDSAPADKVYSIEVFQIHITFSLHVFFATDFSNAKHACWKLPRKSISEYGHFETIWVFAICLYAKPHSTVINVLSTIEPLLQCIAPAQSFTSKGSNVMRSYSSRPI